MRSLSFLIMAIFLWKCAPTDKTELPSLPEDGIADFYDASLMPFYHGVASGDPLADAVIIWTRITPKDSLKSIDVTWEIAESDDFQTVLQSGIFTTDASRDYTVKVDVKDLKANTNYYYRFKGLDNTSSTGRTRTAPDDTIDNLKFGIVSCSNYEWGYFNAYGRIAEREDLHAVLHLGDYIYEYGPGKYGDTTIQRINYPAHEIITLQDYRLRYSQYRLDKDLRTVHERHPFITIWDDHEIANNSYTEGAQNHQPDEGDYMTRKEAARKAYYEWLPVRETKPQNLYRQFSYGSLADLIMLDERLAGRTMPADSLNDPSLKDSTRSMLGVTQLEWFEDKLKNSRATWKIIGNQVIYSYLNWGHRSFNINLDSWDGYPVEQRKIADIIQKNEINNVVFVTGDTHSSWAFEVAIDPFKEYNPSTGEGAFAVEFGTTSVNSANSNERFHTDSVRVHEGKIVNSPINPHLKYANLRDHGYLVLTLTADDARADWYYVNTNREPSDEESLGKSISVKKDQVRLNFID
ncbi:alkaline phosphatase [Fulvivirga sp. M361]|uniref:alkaline phosphatase D family protein n=1 Tax=Fulvivirga sp. M361 TaxID=2594266 RepID=UPI00117A8A7A|nr:alkaline phosphatase D family protein [Fulvivirga sp. M361]TRX62653.1 alkaline phosphatase [Fulvivirga sp. M361]